MATKKKTAAQIPLAPEPAAPGRLTVSRLTVHGVLGVEDSVIDLADITVLEGRNASGKSSHLKALRSALGIDRTQLGRLARIGDTPAEDEPSVEVLLVGEDREVQVSRKGAGSPEVRERVGDDWRKVPRPVEWLRDLIDVEAANPALWLASDDETRAAAVLAAMPLAGYSRAAALDAAGLADFRLPPIPAGLHPLEELEQIEETVRSSRTEVNRQERAEHDAAAKLLAGLPAEPPKDVAAVVAKGDAEASRLAEEIARETEAAESAFREASTSAATAFDRRREGLHGGFKAEAARLRATHEAKAAELRAEVQRQIAELSAETEAEIDALRTGAEGEIAAAEAATADATAAAHVARQGALQALEAKRRDLATGRERLAALREAQRAAETDRHVRATAAEAQAKAKEHEVRARALTAGIEALRRYRLDLAGRLPIKGLAVRYDEKGRKSLTLDGVPLAQVNDGRLVELATEVSLLRSKPAADGRPYLPLVLLDGIERLDPTARAALLREVASRGAQVVAACVAPEALRALRGEAALGGDAA
jgi:hypothetical protein